MIPLSRVFTDDHVFPHLLRASGRQTFISFHQTNRQKDFQMDAEDLLGILIPEGQKYPMNLMVVSFLYFALIQFLLHLKCKCESKRKILFRSYS